MALQIGKDQVGIAKQAGKGTIAANPAFAHGLTGGGIKVDVSQEADAADQRLPLAGRRVPRQGRERGRLRHPRLAEGHGPLPARRPRERRDHAAPARTPT